MKKRLLILVIVIMSMAMAAFIGIQVYWIKNSMELRKANFKRSIDDAVNSALVKLETIEYARLTSGQMNFSDKKGIQFQPESSKQGPSISDSGMIKMMKPLSETGMSNAVNESETVEIKKSRPEDGLKESVPPSITNNPSPGAAVRKQFMINHLMTQMVGIGKSIDVEKLISTGLIDTLLHQELMAKGITIDYEFGVYSPDRNIIVLEKTGNYHQEILIKGFSYPLFTGVGVPLRDFLLVYFPQQSAYNLKSLWIMALASVLLVLTIISAFSFSVFTIIRQRKLSELKNDFINNMTHEFKTPISTISLACQVLSDKEINRTGEMFTDYIQIIGDENQRLGEMSEKILQTAILEKGSLHLRTETMDIHKLIADVIHKIAIQIEIRDGVINTDFKAKQSILKADKVHLSNMIYNLLDNANKYSPRKPQISISTADAENGISISVHDKGMGISKANQKRIFEKLYRVPTGDVHNVKGFGLGLSYVKFIVEKHGGSIQVDSEPNKGSTFTLFLPYVIPEQKQTSLRL